MNKKLIPLAFLAGFLTLIALFLAMTRPVEDPVPSREQHQTSRRIANHKNGKSILLQRYDPMKNPRTSASAAHDYYAKRKALIREFHGDGQIDNALAGLNGDKDLVMWIGTIQRQEMLEGLPRVANLLTHPDKLVQRAAAATLCWFGDKRGFDFLISKMESPDSVNWWSAFSDAFSSQLPTEYIPRIKALLEKKTDQEVEACVIAKILAQFGDASSLNILLPVINKMPVVSVETISILGNVDDTRVTSLMQRLSSKRTTEEQKSAADVVLAKGGDLEARQRLLDSAKGVIGLLQPQNSDGSQIPGLSPNVLREKTPAWDDKSVFALENGLKVIPQEHSVPLLREIAIRSNNVRFSKIAIELLAKISDESAREALWDAARSIQIKKRPFEDTIFTTTGKALMLYADPTSEALAATMFSGDKYGMETSRLLAETRGWDGLFKLGLFY